MGAFERIQELMKINNVTAYRLEKEKVVSQTNISDWKKGKANPSYGAIVKIASYFNVSPEWIEGKTDIQMPAFVASRDGSIKPIDTSNPEIKKLLQQIEKMTEDELRLMAGLAETINKNKKM